MQPGYSSCVLASCSGPGTGRATLLIVSFLIQRWHPVVPVFPGGGGKQISRPTHRPGQSSKPGLRFPQHAPPPEVSAVQLGGAKAGPPGTLTTALLRQLFSSPTV